MRLRAIVPESWPIPRPMQKYWRSGPLARFWGFGFVGIAVVNGYFVNTALLARQKFLDSGILVDPKIDLSNFDCAQTPLENLCLSAQRTEEAWVNFKLFGTLGLTLILIVITVLSISKHIKEKQAESQ